MTIPIATARALNLIGTHPAVEATRVIEHFDDGTVVAETDIANELPAAWRVAGESPSGVRQLETISLKFPAGYPVFAPSVFLRADFNRSHPHINPGPADQPPQPCLVAGSSRELIQTRGIEGLIEQLVKWLDDAMMLKLNNPAAGWEPVRRDSFDDFMVVDGVKMREFADPAGRCIAFQTAFFQLIEVGQQYFSIDHRSIVPIEIEKGRIGRTKITDKTFHGVSIGLIVWAPDSSPGQSTLSDQYLPETVSTVGDLLARAEQYGCRQQLEPKLNFIALGANGRDFTSIPIAITFLARRPYNVIGTNSPIELCSYLIDLTEFRDITKYDQAPVRICSLREQLSIEVLRRTSSLIESTGRPNWTLVGCGSVGSKIAIHLARRGQGPDLVVDKGLMAPHNYARHALLPTDAVERGLVSAKAALLAGGLGQLKQEPAIDTDDIIITCASQVGQAKIAPAGCYLLLNTTASTVVRERLSFVDWEDRPPIAEAHLLGAGRVAYAAFEALGGNPSISDLAAESYRLIAANKRLRDQVFSAEAEAIVIGQGCSAATFAMPDDRLSALTSGLSQIVGARLQEGARREAEIHLAELGDDGLSQTWSRYAVQPWIIPYEEGVQVRISARVDEQIRAEIASRPGSETGGVIVGRFSQIGNAFQVVDVIPAPPDSTFSRDKFVLGTEGLKARIRTLVNDSGGSLYVLGTWHNHLIESGPSGLDAETALTLSLKQYFPTLVLIALPEGYTCVIAEYLGTDLTMADLTPNAIKGDLAGGR